MTRGGVLHLVLTRATQDSSSYAGGSRGQIGCDAIDEGGVESHLAGYCLDFIEGQSVGRIGQASTGLMLLELECLTQNERELVLRVAAFVVRDGCLLTAAVEFPISPRPSAAPVGAP